ncbi:hypothetical protein [Sporisorium scitamineum]|uniref:Meiotically up-regulated gene 152 protein n=1 Tax=Sporisorium scitamineum TaxID=49012 RepID=A0A0F7RTU1_9BASI|nr:hypothetical protein [Sporisorium scitamineum]
MQSQSQSQSPHAQQQQQASFNQSPAHVVGSTEIKSEQSQDVSHLLLASQHRFGTGSQSPLSTPASADQPRSGYQLSSAQSASGDPNTDANAASTFTAGSRRPSALGRKASEGHRNQKHRWSAEETQALVDGCNKHGVGNWKKILSDPELSNLFSDRTAGDLKDRFRTYFPDAYHEMYPNAKTHLSKAVRGRDAEGKSIFEKGKTKERRPFTSEEDAALRAGYQQYGSHWALIAKNSIFNGQRRAIDLRDRFRNAFPEDYERAGFKPRPSKARKDRGPSAAKPGEGHAARSGPLSGTLSDHSLSEGARRSSEYPLSDTTSDGHLTDHGNLTDYSYFTDQGNLTDGGAEPVLSGPPSGASSALGRSNSMSHSFPHHLPTQANQGQRLSFGQALALQQQQQHASVQSRPPFLLSNTAPLPGAGMQLRVSDMVTGQSIHSLFEQLQQASLEGPGTSSETSSVHERATPPSASENDFAQQQQLQQLHQQKLAAHSKAASADDARRQAGKQISYDGVSHKRRSHAARTGKNSALERLPSVHGHLHHMHGHAHASSQSNPHSRPHSQSSSQHHSPAGGSVPIQSDARLSPLGHTEYVVQQDVLAWLNPGGQNVLPESASMDIDNQRAAGVVPSSWSAYSSSASDISGTGVASSVSGSLFGGRQPIYGTGIGFANQSGYTSPTHPGQGAIMVPGIGSASDSSASSATGSRRSSAAANPFAQQQQAHQTDPKPSSDEQANLQSNFMTGPMQNFVDPFSAASGDAAQWNVDWDLSSVPDSGLQSDDVNELLASLPLSHQQWASDFQRGATAAVGEANNDFTNFMGGNAAQRNEAGAVGTSSNSRFNGQQTAGSSQTGIPTNTDGGVSFDSVTYGDPLIRQEREGSPDSLELQREQTFTAKDVGKRLGLDDLDHNKDLEESDDDHRRRSTDTLRRAEIALEQALESVEDTRALAFAQQFRRDVDSDEDFDEEADDDGYEEDEEDDNEPDYELDGIGPDYNFQQVLDELQASDSHLGRAEGISNDFFDGPFDGDMGATPGAPGQPGLEGSDLSLYPDLGRSDATRQQDATQGRPSDGNNGPGQQQGQGGAAAAAGLMNQMWNASLPVHQQVGGMQSNAFVGNAGSFANAQAAGWTSSPGENASPGYGMNRGRPQ